VKRDFSLIFLFSSSVPNLIFDFKILAENRLGQIEYRPERREQVLMNNSVHFL